MTLCLLVDERHDIMLRANKRVLVKALQPDISVYTLDSRGHTAAFVWCLYVCRVDSSA